MREIEIIGYSIDAYREHLGRDQRLTDRIYDELANDPEVYTPNWLRYNPPGYVSSSDHEGFSGKIDYEEMQIVVAPKNEIKNLDALNEFASKRRLDYLRLERGKVERRDSVWFPMAIGRELLWKDRRTVHLDREEVEPGSLGAHGLSTHEEDDNYVGYRGSEEYYRRTMVVFLPGIAAVQGIEYYLKTSKYDRYHLMNSGNTYPAAARNLGLDVEDPPVVQFPGF